MTHSSDQALRSLAALGWSAFFEQVYNAKRLHSALGYQTPEEFETLFAQKAA